MKTFHAVYAACLCLGGVASAGAMSAPEAAKIKAACEANFKPELFSPEAAEKCLASLNADNRAAVRALSAGGPAEEKRAEELVRTASAVGDCANILLTSSSPEKLRSSILSTIQGKKTSASAAGQTAARSPLLKYGFLEDVGLTVRWIQKYFPAYLGRFQEAAYEYSSLDAERQDFLLRRGIERREWEATTFSARLGVMVSFADSVADKYMMISPAQMDQAKFDAMSVTYKQYSKDMSSLKRRLFMRHIRTSRRIMNARKELARQEEEAKTSEQKARVSDLAAKVDTIAGKAPEAQLSALGALFDLSAITAGDTEIVDLSESTSSVRALEERAEAGGLGGAQGAQVAARLQERLSGEVAGTRAGDALMRFYGDPKYAASGANTLRIAIKSAPDSIGFWDGTEIAFSQEFLERWMAERGYTASDLITKETPMTELTRLLAPNFVHEATHQRQAAWAAEKGLGRPIQQDLEVEAFSMGGLYVMEKARQQAAAGNTAYSSQICEDHLRRAMEFKKEGVVGVAEEVSPLYQDGAGESFSTRSLALAETLYAELTGRLLDKARAPAAFAAAEAERRDFPVDDGKGLGELAAKLSTSDIHDLRTPVLRALLDSPFKWYQAYGDKKITDAQWLLENRRALLDPAGGKMQSGAVPALR